LRNRRLACVHVGRVSELHILNLKSTQRSSRVNALMRNRIGSASC
jgi:hypothetical protein